MTIMRIDVQEELLESRSSRLKGKKILVCVTGSVAIFKVPEIIRELVRDGAIVFTMLSPEAEKLVTKDVFQWASGTEPFTEITGNVEHVLLTGAHSEKVDLVIVSPMTANTMGKVVGGIADSNVSLTLMTAIGSGIPIICVPGMHEPMFENKFVQKNIKDLKSISNITFLEPRRIEGKAKLPENEVVYHHAIRLLTSQTLLDKNVLVTGGPTREYIDKVRYLSNPSSGKMGLSFALEAFYQGATVTFIVGPNSLYIPEIFEVKQITSTEEMGKEVNNYLNSISPSIALFSSAVSDYTPSESKSEKIRSGSSELTVSLKPTTKILNMVRDLKIKNKNSEMKVIAFKAEYNKTDKELISISMKYIEDQRADFMVANLVESSKAGFEVDTSEVILVSKQNEPITIKGSKSEIAYNVMKNILTK